MQKPIKLQSYTYNDTFLGKIKVEIDQLLDTNFIYEIEHTEWMSPIFVVLKNNIKLRVCINLKKANATTIRDNYSLPTIEHLLDRVAEKDAYIFLMDSLITTK